MKEWDTDAEIKGKIFYSCMPCAPDFKEWLIAFDEEHLDQFDGNFVVGEDIEVMQYTGLKDKNGKEIYEGDIVKWTHPSFVELKKEYKILHIHDIRGADKLEMDAANGWLEVIGNVYENPNLLK